jgi:hypothetical protein
MKQQKASYKVGDFYNALFLAWEDLFPEIEAIRQIANTTDRDSLTITIPKNLFWRFLAKIDTFVVGTQMYGEMAGHCVPEDVEGVEAYLQASGYISDGIARELVSKYKELEEKYNELRYLYTGALGSEKLLLEAMGASIGKPIPQYQEKPLNPLQAKLRALGLLLPIIPKVA